MIHTNIRREIVIMKDDKEDKNQNHMTRGGETTTKKTYEEEEEEGRTREVREKLQRLELSLLQRLKRKERKKSGKTDEGVDNEDDEDDMLPPPSPIASIDFNPLFRELYLAEELVENNIVDQRENDLPVPEWSRVMSEKELEKLQDRVLELERENLFLKRKSFHESDVDDGGDVVADKSDEGRDRHDALRKENTDLIQQLVSVKVELADKTELLSHAVKEASIVEQKLVAKKLEVAQLRSENEDLRAKVENLGSQRSLFKTRLDGTREQMEAMKKSFSILSKEKARLEKIANEKVDDSNASEKKRGIVGSLFKRS